MLQAHYFHDAQQLPPSVAPSFRSLVGMLGQYQEAPPTHQHNAQPSMFCLRVGPPRVSDSHAAPSVPFRSGVFHPARTRRTTLLDPTICDRCTLHRLDTSLEGRNKPGGPRQPEQATPGIGSRPLVQLCVAWHSQLDRLGSSRPCPQEAYRYGGYRQVIKRRPKSQEHELGRVLPNIPVILPPDQRPDLARENDRGEPSPLGLLSVGLTPYPTWQTRPSVLPVLQRP